MNSKLFPLLNSRRPHRTLTNIISVVAIVLFVVPNYLTGVARASAGDLVAGFGSGGKVTTDFYGRFDTASAVATYPDGRILLAGTSRSITEDFDYDIVLARYNSNGSLDQTFGDGGRVETDFNEMESARAVTIQQDGKIVVAGSISRFDGTSDFLVVRYNEDGTLDSSFGQGGLVTTDFYNTQDFAADLAIAADGEIVVAGTVWRKEPLDSDFGMARYDSYGNLDMTFGSGGKVRVHSEIHESLASMVLTPKGQILLAGETTTGTGEEFNIDFLLARFNRDGSPDASFGVDGRVISDFSVLDSLSDIALAPGGDIIATGTTQLVPGRLDFVVARYNRNGDLDPSFGTAGRVVTDFSVSDDFAFAVAVSRNGKIVIAGRTRINTAGHYDDFAIARYERDGTLDQSFGLGGLVTTDFAGHTDESSAVAILPNGRIIVAGNRWDASNWPLYPSVDFALAAFEWR